MTDRTPPPKPSQAPQSPEASRRTLALAAPPDAIPPDAIARAADLLRAGEVVASPPETV